MTTASPPLKRRRVLGKTPAALTGLSASILVNKAERKRLAEIERNKQLKVRRLDRATVATAELAFSRQPELADGEADVDATPTNVDAAIQPANEPHASHDIKRMASHPIVYCNRCSHFAWHGAHSKLHKECPGLRRGNATSLRLLRCDVVPRVGAVIPPEHRLRYWGPGRKL